jgi:glyoxylase-like metal-dependent hydrolase (beta-lactamase superfamily II)/rhodanese-related sulfurtransferase
MFFRQLFDRDSSTYTYLLADETTKEAVLIDPVADRIDRDIKLIEELGLELLYTLDTHVHADHVTASGLLRQRTGAQTVHSKNAEVECVDVALEHGDTIRFGKHVIEGRATPGHTAGCMTYVLEANRTTYVFTGDTIFVRGCGRTDFQNGSAKTLYKSVHEQIYSLPDDAKIYPGHDYKGHSSSTVAEEKALNPRLRVSNDEAIFVAIMNDLKLSNPKLMHVAVPANLAGGRGDLLPDIPPGLHDVAPEALGLLSQYRIIDIREVDEFSGTLSHLETAERVALPALGVESQNWERDEPLLCVCRSGKRSLLACNLLVDTGFTNVTNLSGGMLAWSKHQLGTHGAGW